MRYKLRLDGIVYCPEAHKTKEEAIKQAKLLASTYKIIEIIQFQVIETFTDGKISIAGEKKNE